MATRAHDECPLGTAQTGVFPLLDLPRLPCSPRRMPSRTVTREASSLKHGGLYLKVPPPLSPGQLTLNNRTPEQRDGHGESPTRSSVINNFLDPNDPTLSEARQSRMHFCDSQRKVDYVLVYHYRNRGVQGSSSGSGVPLAVISNGEMGKEPNASSQGDMMIEMGPHDALEEERKEQREEFEHNLIEAGLELEKDLENKSQGSSFVRIHAPWQVLTREAEFMKIKVPTKKMYEIKSKNTIAKAFNDIIQKMTSPLQPHVPEHSNNKLLP